MALDTQEVGRRVRELRQKADLSLAKLALQSGVSKAYLVRLETDPKANPSIGVLHQIAEALDVTVADLVGRPRVRFEPEERPAPATLLAFAEEDGLTSAEVATLASIRWRDEDEPQTVKRWRYIWQSLAGSANLDREGNDGAKE